MSKADTIDTLMESAIHSFSQFGYEGASLRDIAANAGVPLSTIHMYFGSKSELYQAIEHKAWSEIDDERSELFARASDRAGSLPIELAELFHALAFPIVRRAIGGSDHDRDRIFIVRRWIGGRSSLFDRSILLEVADRSMVRWIDAMARACPTLTRQDVVWAFSFVVGAIFSWQLIDHRYDRLLGEDTARTAQGITADIVDFGCAGVRGLIAKRAAEAGATDAANVA